MRGTVGDNSSFIRNVNFVARVLISSVLTSAEESINALRQFLLPEFFVTFHHVRFTGDDSNFSSIEISHIDAFVLVQGDGTSFFNDFNFNGRNVVTWTLDHPFISRMTKGWFALMSE
jgi:hypothetical protein